MMAARNFLIVALLAVTAAGCSTAPSHFYTLDATATAGNAPATPVTVVVGPVTVPEVVDRPQMVVQVAPNRVDVDEFNRWAAPLNDSIARAVAGDLSVQLGTPDVATGPFANFNPAYRVTIDVERFDSVSGQSALLEAVWTVRKIAGGPIRSGRTVARESVEGDSYEALAAAHSRALAKMSGEIAAVIRSEAG